MARNVPGSGAVIEPIFNEVFGVRAIKVINGGEGYDSTKETYERRPKSIRYPSY